MNRYSYDIEKQPLLVADAAVMSHCTIMDRREVIATADRIDVAETIVDALNAAEPADRSGVPLTDRGPSMQVRSGRMFHPLDPRPEDIDLRDIAAHLAKINRYTGASIVPVPVAYHSVLVEKVYAHFQPDAPRPVRAAVLLHDAAEAYIGDISRPMKVALEARAPGVLKEIESRVLGAVYLKFGLSAPPPVELKHADNVALQTERRGWMAPCVEEWPGLPDPLDWPVYGLDWTTAETLFLGRCDALGLSA